MSHPIPGHDYSDQTADETNKEYATRRRKANAPKSKALKSKIGHHKSTASSLIDSLKHRPGESPLSKLKRLTGYTG